MSLLDSLFNSGPQGGALARLLQGGGGMGLGQSNGYPMAGQPAGGGLSAGDLLDPEIAMPMAGALMAGPTFGEGMGKALAFGGVGLGQKRDLNRSKAYLSQNFPELAAMSDAGAPMDVLWKAALHKRGIGGDTTYSAPTIMTKPDGTQGYVMFGNDGSMKPLDAGGLKPGKTTTRDLGTAWGVIDAGGNLIGTVPKDNYGAAAATAEGTKVGAGRGDAMAFYNSMVSKMPGLQATVNELQGLSDQATYTWTGQLNDNIRRQMGQEPRPSAVARQEYITKVRAQIFPLLRDTFGAQFTKAEGEALLATLGDPDLHPKEKQAVLRAFIVNKQREIEALARQTGQTPPADTTQQPPPDAATAKPRLKYNPDTGELE